MRLIRALGLAGLLGLAIPGFAQEKKLGKAEVGQPAPDFDLPAANIAKAFPDAKDKKNIALKDFRTGDNKKNVVLFFFPKAMTRG